MNSRSSRLPEVAAVAALLIAFCLLAAGYAIRTWPWQAPDEPAHYNYVAQIAAAGCCPELTSGDWDQPLLDRLKSAHFPEAQWADLPFIQYEDHQPPLYYLALTPIYALADGALTALRLASVAIAAVALLAAYAAARVLTGPDRWYVAWGAAAFIAFIPQHLAIVASVNNDSLAELIIMLTLWLLLRRLRGDRVPVWLLGVLIGIGLLTKASTLVLAGVVPLALIIQAWRTRAAETRWLRRLAVSLLQVAVPALLIAGLWWGRNISIYGAPDIFGLRRHDSVVTDQLRTATVLAELGPAEYLARAARTTYNSFFGQFGWMAYPLPEAAYALIGLFLLAVLAGWALRLWPRQNKPAGATPVWRQTGWLTMALVALVGLAQYAYYNLEFYQLQGRYLYPALLPVGLFVALGLDGWARLWHRRAPGLAWLAQLPVLLAIPLNLWVLWRLLPLLAP